MMKNRLIWIVLFISISVCWAFAQTSAFTYQGKLTDGASPATANYDMQFKLFDAVTGGAQVGATVTNATVPVTSGIFTVPLNFGSASFPGADRWIEIGIRTALSANPYTVLAPRQKVTSAPYSVRSLNSNTADTATNSTQLGGVDASSYVKTTSGTTSSIPVWTGGTTLGNSAITQSANGVQLPNGVQLGVGAQGNQMSFGSPNGNTGISIAGPHGRVDIRYDDIALRLVGGLPGGPPASTSGIIITTNGYVGIGGNPIAIPFSSDTLQVFGSSRFNGSLSFSNGNGSDITGVSYIRANSGEISGLIVGSLTVSSLGTGGFTTLCRNASNQIATCSSSLRYKTNLAPYRNGLDIINRLRPISFDWKQGGMKDVGFGAEDVAKIEPLLTTRNEKNEVEGVKYDRLSVVFVNAIKEQQAQIELLNQQIKQQQRQIDSFKRFMLKSTHKRKFVNKTSKF